METILLVVWAVAASLITCWMARKAWRRWRGRTTITLSSTTSYSAGDLIQVYDGEGVRTMKILAVEPHVLTVERT